MYQYRTVDVEVFDDPKMRKYGLVELLLALYLFQNKHSHVTGVYSFSLATAYDDLNMEAKKVTMSQFRKAFKTLCDTKFCDWDEERRVVFVRNMWKRQPHAGVHLDRLEQYFLSLHGTPLVVAFLSKYPPLKQYVTNPALICTDLSPARHESALQEIEQEIEQEQYLPPYPLPGGTGDGAEVASGKIKKPKPSHDPEYLKKQLIALDLPKFHDQYGPQGLNVDAAYQDMEQYVLCGNGKKPYPNPANWVDFNLAFHDKCKWCIEHRRFMVGGSNPEDSWKAGIK